MTDIVQDRARRLAALPLVDTSPPPGILRGAWNSFLSIVSRRELLSLITRREIRAKYKNSALGLLWSLVRPLISLLIYYMVVGQFLGAARGIPNFAIYVFSGITTWGLFSEIVNGCTVAPVVNSGLIKKTRLPREVFPLAATGSALFNLMVQMVILVLGAVMVGGFSPNQTLKTILLLPASLLLMTVWGLAIGMVLGAINVYLRDVQFLVEVFLQIGFWLSPIVYAWSRVSEWAAPHGRLGELVVSIYTGNPATLAVMGVRRVVWNDRDSAVIPDHLDTRILVALLIGLVMLFFAQRVFNRLQRNFAQEL